MTTIVRATTVDAPPEAVWAVLADFGSLAKWVPMIQHSCLLSEQTERPGTVRRVQVARQTLVERVVTWKPSQELAYDIEGLPPIVGTPRTTWRLTRTADRTDVRTHVVVTTEIPTGPNPVKLLVARKVSERMALAADFMLAGLVAAAAPIPQEETP